MPCKSGKCGINRVGNFGNRVSAVNRMGVRPGILRPSTTVGRQADTEKVLHVKQEKAIKDKENDKIV